jgi:hypothetical protein
VTTVQLHVGIPGRAFIRQGREDLLKEFPGAVVTPFGKGRVSFTVRLPEAGLSFVLAGEPADGVRVVSAGFNLDGVYEGMREGPYRTAEGIGKGSTVNDLLGAYGQPADIVDPSAGRGRRKAAPAPGDPRLYQYPSEDGAVTTSFVIQADMVVRIVINDLEPLNRHVLKRTPPAAPLPAPATPPQAPAPGDPGEAEPQATPSPSV